MVVKNLGGNNFCTQSGHWPIMSCMHVSNDRIDVSAGKCRPIKMQCARDTAPSLHSQLLVLALQSISWTLLSKQFSQQLWVELVEASFNSAAEKDAKEKLQQRVRAVERVKALLTDRMNEACFDLNQKHQLQLSQPPTYHKQTLMSVNQCYKEEITYTRERSLPTIYERQNSYCQTQMNLKYHISTSFGKSF